MQNTDALSALHAIFTLQKDDHPVTIASLARHLQISRTDVTEALDLLATCGLCDAERVRLTMRGLAVAANHDARIRRLARTPRAA